MKRSSLSKAVPLSALAAIALAAPTACKQPAVACVTGRGDFAAKYTLVSGTGPCAQLKGDTLGVQSYNGSLGDKPDLKSSTIAIRAGALGDLMARADASGVGDADPNHKPYALGAFATAEPGPDDFCNVPTMAPAEQDLPTAKALPPDDTHPKGQAEQPATSVKYEWSNVRVYDTAAATGTQFSADLTYTQDGCTAQYHVAAVYPAVSCANADGTAPVQELCSSEANPDAGMATGSGISPDFPVVCDPDLLLCVLTKEPPALK